MFTWEKFYLRFHVDVVNFGRRKKVLSKNLRVFLLSILVVMLAAVSASAAEIPVKALSFDLDSSERDIINALNFKQSFDQVISRDSTYNLFVSADKWHLLLSENGTYVIGDTNNNLLITTLKSHDTKFLESSSDAKISADLSKLVAVSTFKIDVIHVSADNVTLMLPRNARSGQTGGMKGDWKIIFEKKGKQSFTIASENLNGAIFLSGAVNKWVVQKDKTLIIDAPFRAYEGGEKFAISMDISGDVTFGRYAEVFGNNKNPTDLTGFEVDTRIRVNDYTTDAGSTYGGKITFISPTALQGSVGVYVSEHSTVVLNFDNETEHDLKGAVLSVDKGTIEIAKDLTLSNSSGDKTVIRSGKNKAFTKTGNFNLTLGTSGISRDITTVNINAGTMTLNGDPSFNGSADFNVNGATLKVKAGAINESTATPSERGIHFKLNAGTLDLDDKAIIHGKDELYPYGGYKGALQNTMQFDIENVLIEGNSTSTVNINGIQAINAISGDVKVNINGEDESDRSVLILTSPDWPAYGKFTGSISGTNVGLYSEKEALSFNARIFRSADLDIKNLIVYGTTKLKYNADTLASDSHNVESIYLRSFRPGAGNETKLSVAELVIEPKSVVEINSVKIDATRDQNSAGLIQAGRSADVIISDIQLYANRSTDFAGKYSTNSGLYALTLDSSAQNSKITIKEVTGDGEGDNVYNVQIIDSSDVKMTGEYPIAKKNSLLAGQNVKLEISGGATIDGNLTFEGSTSSLTINYADDKYPQSSWLNTSPDKLANYSIFTTLVGKNNRVNGGNEYAVKVTGNITLSRDNVKGSTEYYPGRLLVWAKPDLNALDGTTITTLQRFKVLGTTNGTYTSDFATVKDNVFDFRVDPTDTKGVTVEVRKDFAVLKLGDCEFEKVSEGSAAEGKEFIINIPYTLTYHNEVIDISEETEAPNTVTTRFYYYTINGAKLYVNTSNLVPYFYKYEEGEEIAITDNVYDESKYSSTLSQPGVLLQTNIDLAKQVITITGTSYSDDVTAYISLRYKESSDTTYNPSRVSVFPAYQEYNFNTDKTSPWSKSEADADNGVTFFENDTGNITIKVNDMREAVYTTGSLPSLVNGVYVWNNGTTTKTYAMLDENGDEVQVRDLKIRRYNGDYLEGAATTDDDLDDDNISASGSVVTITVPVSVLGTTGGTFEAVRSLAIVGTRVDGKGELVTQPIKYYLYAVGASTDKTSIPQLDQTVTIGLEAKGRSIFIKPDAISGDIKQIVLNVPKGVTYTGTGDVIAYEIGDTSGLVKGNYTVNVIAYVGDNSTSSTHKLYTFTINVKDKDAAGLTGNFNVDMSVNDEPVTREYEVTDNDGTLAEIPTDWSLTAGGNDYPEGLAVGTYNASTKKYTVTVDPLVIEVNRGDVSFSYTYTIKVGEFTRDLNITVNVPQFEIEIDDVTSDTTEGGNYTATITAVNVPAGTYDKPELSGSAVEALGLKIYEYVPTDEDYVTEEGQLRFTVIGVFPEYDERADDPDYEGDDPNTYSYNVTFTVTNGEDVDTATLEDDHELTVTSDEGLYDDAIEPTAFEPESTDIHEATPEWSVMILFEDEPSDIQVPAWIAATPEYADEDETEYAGLVLSVREGADVPNGTAGTIRIADADNENIYQWTVTYEAASEDTEEPDIIFDEANSTNKQTDELAPGDRYSVALIVSGDAGALRMTPEVDWLTLVHNGSTATVAGTATATEGDYEFVIAGEKTTKTLTLTISVKASAPAPKSLDVTPKAATVTVKVGSVDETVKLSADNAQGNVTYTVQSGYSWVTVNNSTGVVRIAPVAATPVRTHTVTITARDTRSTTAGTATVTLTINVEATGNTPLEEHKLTKITASSTALDVNSGAAISGLTVTADDASGDITWTVDGDLTLTQSPNGLVLTLSGTAPTVTEDTSYQVTVGATDAAGNKADDVTITITVKAPAPERPVLTVGTNTISDLARGRTTTFGVSSDKAVTTWEVQVNQATQTWAKIEAVNETSATVTIEVPATIDNGTYTVRVRAATEAGTESNWVPAGSFELTTVQNVGSSGGGCDAGFGALALVLAAPLFLRKKRS